MSRISSRVVVRRVAVGLAVLLAFCAGCDGKKGSQSPLTAPDVLARVGDEVITEDAFRAEATRRKVAGNNEAGKTALLDEMVRDLRLLHQARAKGYDRDPEIVRRHRAMLINRAREDFLPEGDNADAPGVTDEQVAAYYEAHKADYAVPTRVRAAMIYVATPAGLNAETLAAKTRKIAEARAAIIAANLPPASNFGGLAATYSENQETRYIGGDLGYVVKGMAGFTTDPAVIDALFALNAAGQLSDAVTGRDGLYLFKLMEINPAGTLPISRVAGRIRSELSAAKRKQAESSLASTLAAIPAEIHREKLTNLSLPDAAEAEPGRTQPPTVPGQLLTPQTSKSPDSR